RGVVRTGDRGQLAAPVLHHEAVVEERRVQRARPVLGDLAEERVGEDPQDRVALERDRVRRVGTGPLARRVGVGRERLGEVGLGRPGEGQRRAGEPALPRPATAPGTLTLTGPARERRARTDEAEARRERQRAERGDETTTCTHHEDSSFAVEGVHPGPSMPGAPALVNSVRAAGASLPTPLLCRAWSTPPPRGRATTTTCAWPTSSPTRSTRRRWHASRRRTCTSRRSRTRRR